MIVDLLSRKAKVSIQIREMTFDFEAWTKALSTNRSLEDVTISVRLPTLGSLPIIHDLFRVVGRLPKLKQLCFRPGSLFWRLELKMLITLLQENPVQLTTLHIQDIEFQAKKEEPLDELAVCIADLPLLNEFTMAHCRFADTHNIHNRNSDNTTSRLDSLVDVLLKKVGMKKIVLSATRVNALGGCPLSIETLRDVFAAAGHQYQHQHQEMMCSPPPPILSTLTELRLLKFEFSAELLKALFGTLLVRYPSLQTLMLSSCGWDACSLRLLSQLLRNHRNLREVHLLGPCDYFRNNHTATTTTATEQRQRQENTCHSQLADALQCSNVRRFFLEPLHHRIRHNDEDEISIASQKVHVQKMTTNYAMEECRLVSLFAPEWQAWMEFYCRLNFAGRRDLLFLGAPQEGSASNSRVVVHQRDDDGDKVAWVKAMAAVNDDLSCIFYFLLHNPSLCGIY